MDDVWAECLRMWKAVRVAHEAEMRVEEAKRAWLLSKGYDLEDISYRCFFCAYQEVNEEGWIGEPGVEGSCASCPGTLVDPTFCCEPRGKEWYSNPREFYQRLLRLDRKRRKMKAKRKKAKK